MRYPTDLYTEQSGRETVDVFRGYNHNLRIGSGEFYDMRNLTSEQYPVLSPREKRGIYKEGLQKPQGLIAKDALCYVDGGKFFINEYEVPGVELEAGPKQLVSMGAWVIVLPDKLRINTLSHEWERLEACYDSAEVQADGTKVQFYPCTVDGGSLAFVAGPAEPEDKELTWIDTGTDGYAMKQYSKATESWETVAATYVRIAAPGIGEKFRQYDGVTIQGVTHEKLQELNATMVVWDRAADWIVVTGLTPGLVEQAESIRVSRTMPEMDLVIESKNRLWGCKYGLVDTQADGQAVKQVVNEIYASKLGDPTNWNCFMGISTDSIVLSCGTDGPWTGAAAMDTPLFFKEGWLHRVYGDGMPFGMTVTACRGVQKGSEKSLAIVGETLFYKARSGIMAYDGSLPTEVSAALGNEAYSRAVGGAVGNKYYISMEDTKGQWQLFVCDTAKGMWHREDGFRADAFCCCGDELYAIEHGTGRLVAMLGSGTPESGPVEWMAVTGEIGVDDPDQKYLSRLTVRMSMDIGARVRFSVQYDSRGVWEQLFSLTGKDLRSFSLPIRPRRCDHLRLKIEGRGGVRVYSVTKTIGGGSELV